MFLSERYYLCVPINQSLQGVSRSRTVAKRTLHRPQQLPMQGMTLRKFAAPGRPHNTSYHPRHTEGCDIWTQSTPENILRHTHDNGAKLFLTTSF